MAKSLKEILELEPVEVVDDQYVEDPYDNPVGSMECYVCGAPPGEECECVIDDDEGCLPDHEHTPGESIPKVFPEGKKFSLMSLLEAGDPDHLVGRGPDDIVVDDEIEVGDVVDVDSYYGVLKVRVIEKIEDVRDATGYIENDPNHMPNDHMDTVFKGPGFVGDIDPESGESGELVFSLDQVVPNSKLKYSGVDYTDDAWTDPTRPVEKDPLMSDYFDDDDKPAATAWRANPFKEGKVTDFDKFMDKILISEGSNRPPVAPEDNPQRRRAARHQDRPLNKTRYGVK